ncbi:hypothetical protein ACOSP7_016374 [Xanthoceras sorbifolium]
MFWPAARSSNAVDFEIAMGKIRETSVPAYDYLMQIPKHQWSVHEFDQECKSDHNTNNVVEAFNGWLSKLRALSMLTMMENIRRKIMKRIHRRYEAALKWATNIPPAITMQMQKAQQKGRYLDPLQCGEWEFEVVDGERRFVVNLDSKICECGLWAVSGIPCRHALACILKRRDAVEGYVHDYLKKPCYLKTYSHAMHPIPDEHLWPDRRRPGRPKLQRRRGLNEPKKVPRSSSLKCSICHEVGHNSRTCKKKNDGQSGGNQGTTTSSTPSISIATNRRRMEVGSSSTSAPTSATVTRVLWYSNTPSPSSNENQFGLSSQQDVSQSAPQPSQQCSGIIILNLKLLIMAYVLIFYNVILFVVMDTYGQLVDDVLLLTRILLFFSPKFLKYIVLPHTFKLFTIFPPAFKIFIIFHPTF